LCRVRHCAKLTPEPTHDRHSGLAGRVGRAHPQALRRRDSPVEKALKQMCRQNAEITISSVSRRSGVSRTAIHRRKELLALIRAHRPLEAVDTETAPPPAADPETSIVAALRSRLIAKDAQIAELKAQLRQRDQTIAVLHGELEKLIATSPTGHR
jgi:hypothetical protein